MAKVIVAGKTPAMPKLTVRFFQTAAGGEPVREWLKKLDPADRKAIGDDIRNPAEDLGTARKRLKRLRGGN